jgi:hypothetical protein
MGAGDVSGVGAGGGRIGAGGLGRTAGTVPGAGNSTLGGVTNDVAGDVGGSVRGVQQGGMVDQTAGVRVGASSMMVPVANLPGVTASGSTNVSGVVSASGKNVELSSGTRMMFAVAAR